MEKGARVSSPTRSSTISRVRSERRSWTVRGGAMDMIPQSRLTVTVCGDILMRYDAFGRAFRSVICDGNCIARAGREGEVSL